MDPGRGAVGFADNAGARAFLRAVLLAAPGAYQFTVWKHACLARFLLPPGVLMTEWRIEYADILT